MSLGLPIPAHGDGAGPGVLPCSSPDRPTQRYRLIKAPQPFQPSTAGMRPAHSPAAKDVAAHPNPKLHSRTQCKHPSTSTSTQGGCHSAQSAPQPYFHPLQHKMPPCMNHSAPPTLLQTPSQSLGCRAGLPSLPTLCTMQNELHYTQGIRRGSTQQGLCPPQQSTACSAQPGGI